MTPEIFKGMNVIRKEPVNIRQLDWRSFLSRHEKNENGFVALELPGCELPDNIAQQISMKTGITPIIIDTNATQVIDHHFQAGIRASVFAEQQTSGFAQNQIRIVRIRGNELPDINKMYNGYSAPWFNGPFNTTLHVPIQENGRLQLVVLFPNHYEEWQIKEVIQIESVAP